MNNTTVQPEAQATNQSSDELLTVQEVADRLRVDETTVRRWIGNGSLPAIRLPARGDRRVYRVKRSTLRQMMPAGGF